MGPFRRLRCGRRGRRLIYRSTPKTSSHRCHGPTSMQGSTVFVHGCQKLPGVHVTHMCRNTHFYGSGRLGRVYAPDGRLPDGTGTTGAIALGFREWMLGGGSRGSAMYMH